MSKTKNARTSKREFVRITGFSLSYTAFLLLSTHAHADPTTASSSSITTSEVAVPSTIPPAEAPDKFQRFDALSEKGWFIPFFSTADTIVRDAGGVRSALADSGFSFLALSLNDFNFNVLSGDRGGPQVYNGQKPTLTSLNCIYLSYDLSRIGIPNAQINAGLVNQMTTWAAYSPRTDVAINSLNYYQTLFNKFVELKIGYMHQDMEFVDTFVSGNPVGGAMGPNAVIPYEVGLSVAPLSTPGANIKLNFGPFYNKFGVMRSTSPDGFQAERDANPNGLRFTVPGARALLVNEVGYRQHAGEAEHGTWVRVGGMYNFSHFTDYKTGGKSSNNYALYGAVDYQVFHLGETPTYRGLYVGASVNYAPPDQNVYSQYYEGRIYGIGIIPTRPADMVSLVYSHTQFSNYARAFVQEMGESSFAGSNNLTVSYTYRAFSGVYASAGLGYVDRPTFAPQKKNALLLELGINLIF